MKEQTVDIGRLIDEETERRIQIMESPDYVWPTKAGKGDWIGIAAAICVCVALIAGCMTGVIV